MSSPVLGLLLIHAVQEAVYLACGLVSLPGDLVVLQAGPQLELMLPLVNTHAVGHQAQHTLFYAG